MTMKEWIHRMKPARLVIVLILSIIYFLVLLAFSHITHALTLLVQCYHMVCNIIALIGSLIMVKHMETPFGKMAVRNAKNGPAKEEIKLKAAEASPTTTRAADAQEREGTLRNTFGWARIDVLTMLIMCIFMASLCFSLLVEAIRTLLHIDHQDAMHYPLIVLLIGVSGLVLNGLVYLFIGGYTRNQITFLQVSHRMDNGPRPIEIIRDLCSNLFIIICAVAVHFVKDGDVAKFIDPIISIVSCVLLFSLSYPYMKESGMILLQTIPGSIDIASFKEKLLKTFPTIYNVHDLHIWQLTAKKYVSTAHLIFLNPVAYETVIRAIEQFFHDQGICIVTIQPEFLTEEGVVIGGERPTITDKRNCLMNCNNKDCQEKACCQPNSENNLCENGQTSSSASPNIIAPGRQVPPVMVDSGN